MAATKIANTEAKKAPLPKFFANKFLPPLCLQSPPSSPALPPFGIIYARPS